MPKQLRKTVRTLRTIRTLRTLRTLRALRTLSYAKRFRMYPVRRLVQPTSVMNQRVETCQDCTGVEQSLENK